ncbi:MAG: tetratricopeptide repeat protein, partial [Acidobacteria bacterium]
AVRDLARIPLVDRAANALVSYVAYIGTMLWPARLAALYPYPREIPAWWMAALAVLVAASALAVALIRRHPYLFVGWFWYLGTLVPVIGLVQVGNQARADRFTYLPIVGLFLAAAWGVPALTARSSAVRRALPWLATIVVLAAAAAARAQLPHWKDSYALWSNAAAVTIGNERAHMNLGLLFDSEGRRPEAIAHYAEAARLVPRSAANLHHRIAVLLIEEGRLADAAARLSLAVGLEPRNAALHGALGAALERQGRFSEAVAAFQEAVRLQPDDCVARNNLGVALERDGRSEEAIVAYREAIRLRPGYGPAHANLAVSLARLGKLDEAVREGAESVRLDPAQANWFYRLAVLYDRKGDRRAAVAALEAALRIDPGHEAARTLLLDLMK